MSTERLSFDEACRELGISEAELEQLVAAGEISSVKEGDTLYFKKEVVRKFKKSRESEPTILLSDDEINLLETEGVEELELLSAGEKSPADEGTTPRKPVPVEAHGKPAGLKSAGAEGGDFELSLDDDLALPEIELRAPGEGEETDKTEAPKGAGKRVPGKKGEEVTMKARGKPEEESSGDETLLNLDGILEDDSEATTPVPGTMDDNTLLDTDLLELGGESDPFSSDTVEETALGATEQGTLLRGGGARVMQMKRKKSHALESVILAVTCIFLMLPLGISINLVFAQSPEARDGIPPKNSYGWIQDFNIFQGAVEWVADFFVK